MLLATGLLTVGLPANAYAASYTALDLGTLPGGSYSYAYGINGSGQVVGDADTASGQQHAFLWSSGSGMTDLGTLPNGYGSEAFCINSSGQVVGGAGPGPTQAILWNSGGKMINLNSLITDANAAAQINWTSPRCTPLAAAYC